MGTGYGSYSESANLANSTQEPTFVNNAVKLKAGYGVREAYAVEFCVDYIQGDEKKYDFNVDLVKAFDWGIYVNPYIKAGFGAGIIDNRSNTNKSLTYGSFNLSTGIFIPLNEHFDVEIAYDYKHLSYQKVNELDATESRTSNVNIGYVGLNARF
jgi:opacity protein-like surface antigen